MCRNIGVGKNWEYHGSVFTVRDSFLHDQANGMQCIHPLGVLVFRRLDAEQCSAMFTGPFRK